LKSPTYSQAFSHLRGQCDVSPQANRWPPQLKL
jgi:hypothetical protein